MLLNRLRQNVVLEKSAKTEHLGSLELDVKSRQEATIRREETTHRRNEIIEEAARQDQAAKDAKMHDALKLHRFWFSYLQ
jgi:hypothetical protein